MRCSNCDSLNLDDAPSCYNCGATLANGSDLHDPSVPTQAASRRGFRAIWLLWGCGGLAAFMVLCFASCFVMVNGAMKSGDREYGPACSAYLEKFDAGDFSAAWALMGEDAKSAFPEAKHNAVMEGIHSRLGKVKTRDTQFVQAGLGQNGKWGRIIYRVEFEQGNGTIRFELKKYAGEYKVIGVYFESPVLTEYVNEVISRKP